MNADNDRLNRIAARLRQSEPEVPDRGFSNAVMAQLPTARQLPVWIRNTLLLAATMLGAVAAAAQLPPGTFFEVLELIGDNAQLALAAAAGWVYAASLASLWFVRR
ncbi:MAG: hypothetical protein QNJ73_02575 [Gammaproteobacteria bacterium]|nr:hypothetical protein [Gammaproteobacteria bacterium]